MTALRRVTRWANATPLRPATLLGLAALAATVAVSFDRGPSNLLFNPVLVAGFVAGALYRRRSVSCARAGCQVGLIGGLASFWYVSVLVTVPNPLWLTVAYSALVVGSGLCLAVFGGVVGAVLAGWVVGKTRWGHQSSPSR